MKRSEMVSILEEVMSYQGFGPSIYPDPGTEAAGEVLKALEAAGMLPPIDYIDDTGYSNDWEPEDD